MFVFDLRWLLFALLILLSVVSLLSVVFTLRLERKKRPALLLHLLRPLLQNAPLGVLFLNDKYLLQYANPYAQRLLKLAAEQSVLPDKTWVAELRADLQQAQQKPPDLWRYRTTKCALEDNGERPTDNELTIRWWVVQWGIHTVVVVTDSTQQQKAMQQAQFLLSDLSHEFRTPLATLQTHIAVLHIPTVSNEVRQQSLEIMKSEAQQLSSLVNQALELGRLEISGAAEMSAVNLLPLVEGVVAQMLTRAQTIGATISIEADAALPTVWGQPERLKQVFINLIDNGLKYGDSNNQLTVTLQAQANELLCQVCDTGPGIAPEHLPYVTRRFYRAAGAVVPGNGLGLALVAEILRQHQSQLKIESRIADNHAPQRDSGTCVIFTLPIRPNNF